MLPKVQNKTRCKHYQHAKAKGNDWSGTGIGY
jgi:hypothetical protein